MELGEQVFFGIWKPKHTAQALGSVADTHPSVRITACAGEEDRTHRDLRGKGWVSEKRGTGKTQEQGEITP
jgi:hypothetical protein